MNSPFENKKRHVASVGLSKKKISYFVKRTLTKSEDRKMHKTRWKKLLRFERNVRKTVPHECLFVVYAIIDKAFCLFAFVQSIHVILLEKSCICNFIALIVTDRIEEIVLKSRVVNLLYLQRKLIISNATFSLAIIICRSMYNE